MLAKKGTGKMFRGKSNRASPWVRFGMPRRLIAKSRLFLAGGDAGLCGPATDQRGMAGVLYVTLRTGFGRRAGIVLNELVSRPISHSKACLRSSQERVTGWQKHFSAIVFVVKSTDSLAQNKIPLQGFRLHGRLPCIAMYYYVAARRAPLTLEERAGSHAGGRREFGFGIEACRHGGGPDLHVIRWRSCLIVPIPSFPGTEIVGVYRGTKRWSGRVTSGDWGQGGWGAFLVGRKDLRVLRSCLAVQREKISVTNLFIYRIWTVDGAALPLSCREDAAFAIRWMHFPRSRVGVAALLWSRI